MRQRLAKHAPHLRRGAKVILSFTALVAVVVAGSLCLYFPTRTTQNETTQFGDYDNPNRVNITAWLTKVDPSAETVSISITEVRPMGTLADEQGFYRDDATFYSLTSLQNVSTPLKKGDVYPPLIDQRVQMSGLATDYPFDRYHVSTEFHVDGGPDDGELPVAVTLYSTDPFFAVTPSYGDTEGGGVDIELDMRRSTPTLVYATFVMVLMLGLAVAASTAAYYCVRWRKGLLFPACSMMAAMLFALVPLRNAVPGSPPIGSVIDFASFFIAAIIISISLITSVLVGYRVQLITERSEPEPVPEPEPEEVDESEKSDDVSAR
jgi:Domain of unknown function (DUF4436)